MNDLKVWRLTGVFGLAIVALGWAMVPLYWVPGPAPQFQDTARFIDYWASNSNLVLARVLVDIVSYVCMLVFASGFRHLIRQARSDYEWVGTLAFGAFLVLSAVNLVGASLEGGAALDTAAGPADPTAIRALSEGYILIYMSIGCILIALFSAAAGYATLGTGVLPRWTGWIAYASAILNLVAVPLGLFSASAALWLGSQSAALLAVLAWVVIGNFTFPIWLLIVSILMIRSREATAPTPAYGG